MDDPYRLICFKLIFFNITNLTLNIKYITRFYVIIYVILFFQPFNTWVIT